MGLAIALALGVVAGLMASVPLGPIGVLCIQRTLTNNRLSGFVSGLGAATADTLFAVAALFAVGYINSFIEKYNFWVELIGGLLIIIFGMTIYFKRVKNPARRGNTDGKMKKMGYLGNYFSVLFVTLPNPAYFFIFVWIFAAMGVGTISSVTWTHSATVLVGVALGACMWWFTLTYFVNKLRRKFNYRGLWWLNKISGGVIMLLGVGTVIKVVWELIPFLNF